MIPRRGRYLLLAYLALWVISQTCRREEPQASDRLELDEKIGRVHEVRGLTVLDREIDLVYGDEGRSSDPSHAVILLHGSPGAKSDLAAVASVLAREFRVIRIDLPGFGKSTRKVADYSILAHARYVAQLLERLKIERFDVVGFSMGGGVALHLIELERPKARSLVMLSAIGVQELEWFGDHQLNHLIHGAQLAVLWTLRELVPHFGMLDGAFLGVEYARNFFDSDQRPLRGILERLEVPTWIYHGEDDFLVSAAVAREHHRIVAHSELEVVPGSHFLVFTQGQRVGEAVVRFLERVEQGAAQEPSDATPGRVEASLRPFDPLGVPPLEGFALFLSSLLIALSTLVSEDLTCVATGALVGFGRISLFHGSLACFLGIYVGDLLLFLAGRFLGRSALTRAPLRWFLDQDSVTVSSAWFERRGAAIIFLSRFVPGMRLPTYFAAGMLRTSLLRFAGWFFVAAALWTPMLVWISGRLGGNLLQSAEALQDHLLLGLVLVAAILFIVLRLGLPLFTYRGRRSLLSRWKRWRHWEFWPPWLFYPPVVAYVLWLAVKHRGLTVFTAANPAIPAGGFIGESKWRIQGGLRAGAGVLPTTRRIEGSASSRSKVASALEFLESTGLKLPVVLKPDQGQRGGGVMIARAPSDVDEYFRVPRADTLVQEFVPGIEFGIFYVRRPSQPRGRIFAITEKRLPEVVADGRRTIEELILEDSRAVAMSGFYFRLNAHRLTAVPSAGERVRLSELGTHCRGCIFLDGMQHHSAALESAIDELSRSFEGFYFGRYDVCAASIEELRRGRFKVIELNGVTSEATSIYDRRYSVLQAWRTLREQWRIAFEIGAENRRRGARVCGWVELWSMLRAFKRPAEAPPVPSLTSRPSAPERPTGTGSRPAHS